MKKHSESVGSAPPDPVKAMGAVSPVPSPAIANKTAPGRTGPRGLSPRTTYSRVNTGPPPVPDAGAMGQKSVPPRGMEFLPAKVAHEEPMTTAMARPTLQTMVKAAMQGTISKSQINEEATRQMALHNGEEPEKTASVDVDPEHYSTEEIHKLASALEYIEDNIKQADDGNVQQPGQGPGALPVLEAKSDEKNLDAGESGKAIAQNLPPQDPKLQKEEVQVGKANTALESNDGNMHPEQPVEPIKNERASIQPANPLPAPTTQTKESAVLFHNNLVRLGLRKESSAPIEFIRKVAEDALSPSKIEAGRQNPPDASASEEAVPKQPSDVQSQARSMVGSNDAAINYKKRDAKENPKSDVAKVLAQPPLTRRHDPVLQKTLDNAGKAGVKFASIAEDASRVTAARALLSNLMDKQAEEKKNEGKKKEKESMMGAAPTSPSAASGFQASGLQ